MSEATQIPTDVAKEANRLKGILKKASDGMIQVEDSRSKTNAQANEIREGLRKEGLNVEAFGAARNFKKTKSEKQRAFDLTYILTREALGQPIQREFDFSELLETAAANEDEAKSAEVA